jgi:LytS/YehU family sensor histidine kinase
MSHGFHLWGLDRHVWIASATSFLLTYGFAVALVTGFDFYRRLRDSELRAAALERALSAAQLASLRMQLSPHTLFNLLHTIRGHIAWDPPSAQAMVVQLGDLLRGLLAAGSREFTLLSEEMQFVRLYLGLQQRRFTDRMSVVVPPHEALPRAWVPSLILQPLIENAIVHGMAGHDGPLAIRVEVLVREETLLLRVSNTTGAGPRPGGAGIGLRNVRERLAIQFGKRASLHAVAGLDHVWLAEVRLPLLRDGTSQVAASPSQSPGPDAAPVSSPLEDPAGHPA